jgi:hypothetical protein
MGMFDSMKKDGDEQIIFNSDKETGDAFLFCFCKKDENRANLQPSSDL